MDAGTGHGHVSAVATGPFALFWSLCSRRIFVALTSMRRLRPGLKIIDEAWTGRSDET